MVLALWVEHRTYPYHGHVLPLYYVSIWWGQRDLNPYDISHRSLSSARLPIPSYPHFGDSGRSRTDDQGVAVLRLTTWLRNHFLAGIAGVEPAHQGVKVPCLTTWLHPYFFWWAEQDSNLRTQRGLIYSQLRLTNFAIYPVLSF